METKQNKQGRIRRRDRGGGGEEVVKYVSEVARLLIFKWGNSRGMGRAGN